MTYANPSDPRINENQRLRREGRRREVKAELVALLGGACGLCGYNRSVAALDFDHLDPSTKSDNVGTLLERRAYEKARAEAQKCRLLCANCHREQTFDAHTSEAVP